MSKELPHCLATHRLINQALEMADGDHTVFFNYMHFTLCSKHVLDDTGNTFFKAMWNPLMLAWACDNSYKLVNEELNVYDYKA